MNDDELQFLEQSNWIEGVYDPPSLDDAVRAWKYLKKQTMLTIDVVEIVHRLLMKNKSLPPEELGAYRKSEVTIGGRMGLNAVMIPQAMDVWLNNANLTPSLWKEHHVQFEKVHPFIDGNGRTGRMFMNWERLKAGLPVLVIKEEDKNAYYFWFQ
jgi:fido (protein-threonine AMPylation protein)